MASLVALSVMTLSACGEKAYRFDVVPATGRTPISVTSSTGMPYTFADGAQAKKHADALCGTGGVRTSIYDRFDSGTWVYPEGCA
jgi:hypothetical protein